MKRIYKLCQIVCKHSKLHSLFLILQNTVGGILPSLQVVVIANLINETMHSIENGEINSHVYFSMLILILLISYSWIEKQISLILNEKIANDLRLSFKIDLIRRCTTIEYQYFEQSNTQDTMKRIIKNPEEEVLDGFRTLLNFVRLFIHLLGLSIIIIINVKLLGVIIVFLYIPMFYLSIRNGKVTYEANKNATFFERKYEYLHNILTNKSAAVERFVYKYNDFMEEKWENDYKIASQMKIKAFLEYFFKTRIYSLLTTIVSIIMIYVLFESLKIGSINLGLFISLTNNIISIIILMVQQLTHLTTTLTQKLEFINELQNFHKIPIMEKKLDSPKTINNKEKLCIEFVNVYFKYAGSDTYIIKGLSCKLETGKSYAFVGENGAGKTTIVKLLIGLYTEYEGDILINGVNIKEYAEDSLKDMMSVMFQDFSKYNISLYENIKISNRNECSEEKYAEVLKRAKLNEDISNLKYNDKTILGKFHEDDMEFSHGQWQRVAYARCLMKNSVIKIYDEPTASIDPVTESEMIKDFHRPQNNHIAIYVSHRLGAIKNCDVIFVLEQGKIIEQGNFDELIKIKQRFSTMYKAQRSWYYEK